MKSKVLNRPMFKGSAPEEEFDVENVGIMQGFKDLFNDDDTGEEDDEYQSAKILGRTPDSPEILMNNLRGDMRSMDARREELADLVGYAAAAETPQEVLAMLQPVLAQQGIGALPTPEMMPPPGMPPGPMPQMPMSPVGAPSPVGMPSPIGMPNAPMPPSPSPMDQGPMPPPVGMARGGIVQRFSEGTPAPDDEQDGGVSSMANPSEETTLDLDTLTKLLNVSAAQTPDLAKLAEDKAKVYKQILGSNEKEYESQAMLDLAGLAFGYAANIDPRTGRPMRGSPFARFAQAASAAPSVLGKYRGKKMEEDRGIKLAALNAAEATLTAKQKADYEIAKEKAKRAGNYGLGSSWQANRITILNTLRPDYVAGKLNEEQKNLFEMLADTMKSTSTYTDEKGNVITRVTGVPENIKSVLEKGRGKEKVSGGAPGVGGVGEVGAVEAAPTAQGALPTMVSMIGRATGPVNVTATFLERYSGGLLNDVKPGAMQADAFVSLAQNRLNRALAENPRFSEGEREQIQGTLDLLPGILKGEGAFVNRAIGLDALLARLEVNALRNSRDEMLHVNDQNLNARDYRAIQDARSLIGIRDLPLVETADDIRTIIPKLKIGEMYKLRDPKSGVITAQRKLKEGRFK